LPENIAFAGELKARVHYFEKNEGQENQCGAYLLPASILKRQILPCFYFQRTIHVFQMFHVESGFQEGIGKRE